MDDSKERCPYCHADLQGEPIPAESQKVYGTTHYTRKIGMTSISSDRTKNWKCPDCNMEWTAK